MPSRQQKFAKKGSKRYLMFGPNHILVTLRWADGSFPGHENNCQWFLADGRVADGCGSGELT